MSEIATRNPSQALIAQIRRDDFKEQLQMALPPSVTADKFVRVAATAILANPDIVEADRESVIRSFIQCAQMGLLPDGTEAALVIFNSKVKTAQGDQWIKKSQLIPMVGGFRRIAAEYGWTIEAHVVRQNDEFEYRLGLDSTLIHNPPRPGVERGEMIAAYAVAKHKDGRRQFEVMDADQVNQIREASKAKDYGPWKDWTERMWAKTAARRLFKQLPLAEGDKRVDNLLKVDELEPGEAAALMYGGDASRELPPAAAAVAPQQADGADREPQTASEPASSAPGATVEPEPDIGSPEGYNSPEGVDSDDLVIAAKHAALVEIPNGKHKGTTLGQLVEKGEEATGWIRWALRTIEQPEEYRRALWAFARVYAPDVFTQVLAEKEAAA